MSKVRQYYSQELYFKISFRYIRTWYKRSNKLIVPKSRYKFSFWSSTELKGITHIWNWGLLSGVFFCSRGKLTSCSLWSRVTNCSIMIIKNAEIKFKHRTRKKKFKEDRRQIAVVRNIYKSKKVKKSKSRDCSSVGCLKWVVAYVRILYSG